MANRQSLVIEKVMGYQALLVILTSIAFFLVGGFGKGLSSALGGAAAFIPNMYFAIKMRRVSGLSAKKIVNSFYAAESGKFVLTAALFVLIFQIPNLEILPLFVCYVAALSVFWFALLMP